MIKLDIDTIQLFKGEVNQETCICFYGEEGTAWNILYKKDLSILKSQTFYSIINPAKSQIILNIYVFNYITDALAFYHNRGAGFFSNSLLVIVDEQTTAAAAQDLRNRFNNFNPKAPKLHFFHRPEKADLYLFYLHLLKRDFTYEISSMSQGLILHLKSKLISLSLSFSELTKLRFLLGINGHTFRIKNKILSIKDTKQLIIW